MQDGVGVRLVELGKRHHGDTEPLAVVRILVHADHADHEGAVGQLQELSPSDVAPLDGGGECWAVDLRVDGERDVPGVDASPCELSLTVAGHRQRDHRRGLVEELGDA